MKCFPSSEAKSFKTCSLVVPVPENWNWVVLIWNAKTLRFCRARGFFFRKRHFFKQIVCLLYRRKLWWWIKKQNKSQQQTESNQLLLERRRDLAGKTKGFKSWGRAVPDPEWSEAPLIDWLFRGSISGDTQFWSMSGWTFGLMISTCQCVGPKATLDPPPDRSGFLQWDRVSFGALYWNDAW